MAINFFKEETTYNLNQRIKRKKWLKELARQENYAIHELNFILCSDEYLHKINLEYLEHDTYTDIITFDNSDKSNSIEGDIFVSIDRIIDNSADLNTPIEQEINRVLSHGLFHLLGYKDKTKAEALLMRNKENFAINLFDSM